MLFIKMWKTWASCHFNSSLALVKVILLFRRIDMLTHFFTSILSTADRAIPATFLAAPPIQAYTRIWILNNAENIISKCIFPYCDGGESYE